MTSTLEGAFITNSATFRHVDALGATNFSLVNSVNIHEMNHLVRITVPEDDGIPDFLVNDTTNVDALPDNVYSSAGPIFPVASLTNVTVTGTLSEAQSNVTVTVAAPSGWVYLQFPDPSDGTNVIATVQRSDGVSLLLANVWQTPERIHMIPPQPQALVHLFDYNSSGSYTITYGPSVTAPVVTTLLGVSTNATSATLNAQVNPGNADTTVFFNWGTTTNYGNVTYAPQITEQLGTPQDAYVVLEGLLPQTTYHFQAVAANSAGASYGGDSSFTTTNLPPPVITNVGPYLWAVGQSLVFTNHANEAVTWALGSGAPAGALLSSNKGVFSWQPSCVEGSSTNLITIWATDIGDTTVSNSTTFLVIVGDCVQVALGSAVVQGGQTGSVPVTLTSSLNLTSLSFALLADTNHLGGWSISSTNSAVASAITQTSSIAQAQFALSAGSGQAFRGPTVVAQLGFQAVAGHSAFVPLTVTNLQGTESNGVPAGNAVGYPGRVVVVGIEPLLEGSLLDSNLARVLTLYAPPGAKYALQTATNLEPAIWQTGPTNSVTNIIQVLPGIGGSNPPSVQYYRAMLVP